MTSEKPANLVNLLMQPNIAHRNQNCNTSDGHAISPLGPPAGEVTILRPEMQRFPHERLKLARVAAGWRTAKSFAEAKGIPQSTYALHEGGKRPRGLAESVGRYAKELGNCSPEWLLTGQGYGPVANGAGAELEGGDVAEAALTLFNIVGSVESGAWRESPELPDEEQEQVHYEARPEYQGARRFGMRVLGPGGPSQVYQPGTVLDCISFEGIARAPQEGDHVIVYRRGPDDLIEATVREVIRNGVGWVLTALTNHGSNHPPIRVPDLSTDPNAPVRIVGFVIGAYTRRL